MKYIKTFNENKDVIVLYNFKVGDHIFCIDAKPGLEYGKEYIVIDIDESNFFKLLRLKDAKTNKIIKGESENDYWLEYRFCPEKEFLEMKYNV